MVLADLIVGLLEAPLWLVALLMVTVWLLRPYFADLAEWWRAHRPQARLAQKWRGFKRKKGWG
jgi:hypothetical protein